MAMPVILDLPGKIDTHINNEYMTDCHKHCTNVPIKYQGTVDGEGMDLRISSIPVKDISIQHSIKFTFIKSSHMFPLLVLTKTTHFGLILSPSSPHTLIFLKIIIYP